jgi:hypothetical protein
MSRKTRKSDEHADQNENGFPGRDRAPRPRSSLIDACRDDIKGAAPSISGLGCMPCVPGHERQRGRLRAIEPFGGHDLFD